ncbi:MAG: Gfo/Idh/MocA family oxidoreductase, partial [Planctomycetaceae bacterium]|nr:Gfo/Idh/MocA family oxidoreductase [Planctomycetaceae bacterium]
MTQRKQVSRRNFLKTTGAGAAISAGLWASGAPAAESTSANELLKIMCVGTANRAAADVSGVAHENIVALCDIDKEYLDRASAQFPSARTYEDYREMIEQEADKADAVVVATADHNHAPASIRAIRKKLHVYCEKPLTHTVEESRIIAEAAKKFGVATQLGTQIHAGDNYRRAVELIKAGTIGPVERVHVWLGGSVKTGQRVTEGTPPKGVAYDLWVGPAPMRPFHPSHFHFNWRYWWDFGGGALADLACHYMDLPFWALKLRHPTHCEAEGAEVHPQMAPTGLIVRYKYPAREDLVACNLTWYDGDLIPKEVAGQRVPANGVMFVGTEGLMFADYGKYKLFPSDKFAGFEPPPKNIPDSIGHHQEWIRACKDGSSTTCNFDYSGALTESVLLGNVAYRTGTSLDWDAANLKATN